MTTSDSYGKLVQQFGGAIGSGAGGCRRRGGSRWRWNRSGGPQRPLRVSCSKRRIAAAPASSPRRIQPTTRWRRFCTAFCAAPASSGLQGMSAARPLDEGVTLVRPLLKVRREAIEQYIQAEGIPFREDATNERIAIHT